MPPLKKTKPVGLGGHQINVGAPGQGPPPSDVQIDFTRVTPIRAAADPFKLGITFTHETLPGGGQATAVTNFKALMVACNWDFVNSHNHGFGANGPWLNADKVSGYTYATRNSWTGWTAFDARMAQMRECGSTNTKYMFTLLPPGWCKMDGGSNTNAASDPLGAGRTWTSINYDYSRRHTDAHRVDMIDIAKAIGLRHTDVEFFSIINEQKGNFATAGYVEEQSRDGLTNINNYFEQERYQEGLRTGLDSVGLTAVDIIGPYMALEGSGADDLAVTFAADGFPQPSASNPADATHYTQTSYVTGTPNYSRSQTYAEWFQANVSAASRSNYFGTEWKTLAEDNNTTNWSRFFPWRWKFMPMVRAKIVDLKTWTGFSGVKLMGMETYIWKITSTQLPSDDEQGAMAAEMLRIQLEEGCHADLRWAPESGATTGNRGNLTTTTTITLAAGGGSPRPAYYAHKYFCDYFRGVNVYACTTSDDEWVTAVASPTVTLLINHTANPVTVSINSGDVLNLTAFEVRVVTA